MTRAILLVLTLALVACGGGRVVRDQVTNIYSPLEFSYAGRSGELATVVHGNPFGGVEQDAFARTVTQDMRGRHFGPPTNFTTTPSQETNRLYRVVLTFNPAEALPNPSLCNRDTVRTAPPGDGPIRLQAVFCRGGTLATGVSGYAPPATSPTDPRFRQMIADVTFALFPPSNPDADDDDCNGFLFANCG